MIQLDQIEACIENIQRHRDTSSVLRFGGRSIELRRIIAQLVREAYWEGYHARDQRIHSTVILSTVNGKPASRWLRQRERQEGQDRRVAELYETLNSLSLKDLKTIAFKINSKLFYEEEVKRHGVCKEPGYSHGRV